MDVIHERYWKYIDTCFLKFQPHFILSRIVLLGCHLNCKYTQLYMCVPIATIHANLWTAPECMDGNNDYINNYLMWAKVICQLSLRSSSSVWLVLPLPHPITMATTPTHWHFLECDTVSVAFKNMLAEETFKLMTRNMCSIAQYSDKMIQHSADKVYWELLIDSLLWPRGSLHNPPLLETLKQTLEPLTVMQSPETETLKIDCATSILESPRTRARLQPHSPDFCGLNTPIW